LEIGSCRTICPGWLGTPILLISASWVARIIGVSHRRPFVAHAFLLLSNIPLCERASLVYPDPTWGPLCGSKFGTIIKKAVCFKRFEQQFFFYIDQNTTYIELFLLWGRLQIGPVERMGEDVAVRTKKWCVEVNVCKERLWPQSLCLRTNYLTRLLRNWLLLADKEGSSLPVWSLPSWRKE
jgi:hypothetical protein